MATDTYIDEYNTFDGELDDFETSDSDIDAYADDVEVETHLRIDGATLWMMVGVAIVFDAMQIAVIIFLYFFTGGIAAFIGMVANTIISVIGWLTFFMWFKIKHVGLIEKKFGRFLMTMFVEFIPFLKGLPLFTLYVYFSAKTTQIDDKKHIGGILEQLDRFI
tara:strand:- start:525 stop:1013 length:489 start_codon:yes stop_codon:yes gene_type:complete